MSSGRCRIHALLIVLGALYAPPAQASPQPPSRALDFLRDVRSPRRVSITYFHRAWNRASTSLEDVEVAMAVPPSDERQEIHEVTFHPEPDRITSDAWGQRTAHFRFRSVPPGGEVEVHMAVRATLSELEWRITERDVGAASEVPDDIARQFLRDGDNYRIDDELIREAARELLPERAGTLERVRLIHDFVIDHLEYARDSRWEPAGNVLRGGRGSCSEYTYLMIALCRAGGIPARYAGGSFLEEARGRQGEGKKPADGTEANVDRIFHRWVEVYLPRVGWFPVDPTKDDEAAATGRPYLHFGRLSPSFFTMSRSDGDSFEAGRLGCEYRSSMRWRGQASVDPALVPIERCARWDGATAVVAR